MGSAAALELAGVGKSYGLFEKKRALRGVSLRVERGECFGLAGANGAGKTTLIRILLGLMDQDEGDAWLLGERPDDPEVRRRVGFVPESATLPETASPRALVRRWARLRGLAPLPSMKQGLEALERLGMEGLLDRPSGRLSKGERQRTLLALAMLGTPELLVLDEPTDGLDPLGRARMREVIREECEAGRTVFLNSHLLGETERICTRVGILHRGELVRVEQLTGPRGAGEPATSAIVIASPLTEAALVRARVRSVPEGSTPLRDLLPAGATLLVHHQDLQELNSAIDRVRAEGGLLVEVRRVKADLEAALAEVAGGSSALAAIAASSPEPSIQPALAALIKQESVAPEPSRRFRPLRGAVAVARVAQEIAADLSSRRVGWLALGAAALATFGFIAIVRSETAQGAAAAAHAFGAGHLTDPVEVAAFIGAWTAKVFFWSTLLGSAVLSAVFSASLLEPRRTQLLFSQPITRADYALGIWTATVALALVAHEFFTLLAFFSLRFLGIAAPAALLFTSLIWALAFGAILALQLLASIASRSALFTGIVGFGLVWGTAILGSFSRIHSAGAIDRALGLLYALLPHSMELMDQSARLGAGQRPHPLAILPTAALLAAYLLLVRVAARRSER